MKPNPIRLLAAAALLLGSILPATAADFTSTWNGTTGNWNVGANWSTPGAPGTFPNNGSPTPTYDAIQNGGGLTVNQAITIQKYNLTGGNNLGAGFTLTLNDLLTWSGGVINGSGTINANGGATFSGADKALADSRLLNLGGASTWSGGNLGFFLTSSLVNTAGGVLTTTFDGTMNTVNGGSFTNAGTFTKSAGAGTTTISVPFTNSGTMNADSGVLSLNANGTHSGTLAAGAGGILRFTSGTHNLNAGTSFSGAGTIQVTGGGLTVNAATASAASTTFSLSGGSIGGAGTLTLSGPLTWTGGTFNGSSTHANGGATLSGGAKSIGFSQVVNLGGTSTWSAGNIDFFQTSSLVNKVGATLTTTFGGTMQSQGGGGLVFTNAGTFTKNTSSATTTITIPFNNTGIVNVDNGTLLTNNGGTSTGAWNVATGATLTFASGTHNLNAGTSFSGAGTIQVTGGGLTVNAATASAASTTFSLSGGSIGGAGTLTLNGPLTWTGGTFNGSSTHANGGATLSGGAKSIGFGQVVNLGGTSTWSAGNIDFFQTSSLVNKVGATLTTSFGGTMQSQGGGGLVFTNAGTFTKNTSSATTTITIPFNNTGIVNVDNGTLLTNNGGTSTGAWNVATGATLTFASGTHNLNAGTSFSGAGTIQVTGGGLTFNAGTYSVTGTTQVNGGTASFNAAASTGSLSFSSGALNVVSSTLSLGNGSSVLASTWSGGTLTLTNGGTLTNTVGSTLTTNFAGTLAATGTGTKTFNNAGTFTKSGAVSTTTINSVLNNTGTVNANSGTLTLAGGVTQHSVSTITGGTWNVTGGTLNISTGSNITTIGSAATVMLSGATSSFTKINTLATNQGTFHLANDRDFTTAGAYANSGTTRVEDSGTVMTIGTGGASAYTQSGPSSVTILAGGAMIDTSAFNLNGGALRGTGIIDGNLVATSVNATLISPGASPGTITVNGSTVLGNNNTLTMELGGLLQGTEYDYLDVNGVLTLGGLLDLDFINGFESILNSGNLLTLATANSAILGSFSNVSSGGYLLTNFPMSLQVFYGAGSPYGEENLVIALPEPARAVLLLLGVAGSVMRRRRSV